jgi:uncharacterized membrane protein
MLSEVEKEISRSNTVSTSNRSEKTDEEKAEEFEKKGKVFKRAGLGLMIPGLICTTYGIFAMGVIYPHIVTKDTYLISGAANLVIGIHLLVPGAVFYALGKKKIKKAEELRSKSNEISFSILPVISPQTKTYGAVLSMSF